MHLIGKIGLSLLTGFVTFASPLIISKTSASFPTKVSFPKFFKERNCHLVFSSNTEQNLWACPDTKLSSNKVNFFYHPQVDGENSYKQVSNINLKDPETKTIITLKLSGTQEEIDVKTHKAEDFWDFKNKSLDGMCEFKTVNEKFLTVYCVGETKTSQIQLES